MAVETVAVAASAAHLIPKPYNAGLVAFPMTAAIATTSLDDVGDIVELGYLPANCTVLGVIIQSASLAASALVVKIQIAGADFVTGITTAVAGGGAAFYPAAPLALTAVSKVTLNITTAAVTPAAGSFTCTPVYVNQ